MYEMKEAEEFKKNVSRIRTKDNRMETKANFVYQKLSEYGDGLEESLDFRRSQSILNTFYDIDNILAVESGVIHEPLGYAGTVDCIVQFRNKIYLIDWKTSKRRKNSWRSCYDYPVQLAAYAAAVNADPAYDFAVSWTNHHHHHFNYFRRVALQWCWFSKGPPRGQGGHGNLPFF